MSETIHSVRIDGKTFHLPFIDEIPFDEKQDAELGESIEDAGRVEVPIVVWKERRTSDSETVVDGAHRAIHASQLNLPIPIQQRSFKTEQEALDYVYLVNYRRRQLSPQQLEDERKERIARVVAARQEGESLRTIAEREGKHESTIRDDLAKATAGGGAVEPPDGKVDSKDGRKRPAKKPVEIDLRCDDCKRKGDHNEENCAGCKEKKSAHFKRKKRPKKHEQNGAVIWDQQEFDKHFGPVARMIDALLTAKNLQRRPQASGLRHLLDEVLKSIKAILKEKANA